MKYVLPGPAAPLGALVSGPIRVRVGDSVTLHCTAEGTAATVEWLLGNTLLSTTQERTDDGRLMSEYLITAATDNDEGTYFCRVSSPYFVDHIEADIDVTVLGKASYIVYLQSILSVSN